MGYGRTFGNCCGNCRGLAGAFGPRRVHINGGGEVKPARGFRGPVGRAAPAVVKQAPVRHVPPKLNIPQPNFTDLMDRGVVMPSYDDPTASDPAMQFRYSEDQIREMLQRGASETMERSGESDGGLPADDSAQQQSREASATAVFENGASGPGFDTVESDTPNILPLIATLAAAWYFGT